MTNPHFSFIVLTLNEELHLARLLNSIHSLKAKTYIFDSGSTDQTLNICKKYKVEVAYHPFENHPTQWNAALKFFQIKTPWVVCLDADQIITPELLRELQRFKDEDHLSLDGIYFNRKNYYKGRWLKYGGYYPKYLLKMFRFNKGYSDITENMDHKFQVPGNTIIWKTSHLIEENLKENHISFWITKHNRYSDLLADEELKMKNEHQNLNRVSKYWGSPNERNAWLKKLWWQMPLYLRPLLYFTYRMIFQLGILDGKTGITYHFLQGFWFRLIVDIKIEEKRIEINQNGHKENKSYSPLKFLILFLSLFFLFYSFNLTFIGITSPQGIYIAFIDKHLNYIREWRNISISSTAQFLKYMGFIVYTSIGGLNVKDHSGFHLAYSCLGYGIMSCFAAFVIAYPKPVVTKCIFLITGLIVIQVLNILRFTLISIYYHTNAANIDHHLIFNCILYSIVVLSIYFYTNNIK